MIIGFTGTRNGLTEAQRLFLREYVRGAWVTGAGLVAHHGDCIGADAEFDAIARQNRAQIRIHGANVGPYLRAKCRQPQDIAYPAKTPLERNQDIVNACEVLIACPATMTEERRSGTWATIRMARRAGRQIVIVLPDGTVREETYDCTGLMTGDPFHPEAPDAAT